MYIYKVTNTIDNMIYIGQCKKSYDKTKSYYGSGVKIRGEIYIHGKENFIKELLEECSTLEDLDIRESYWIQYYDSANPAIGYNTRLGGNSSGFNTSFKNKMSNATVGDKNPFYGKKHNIESINKMSNSKKGSKNPNFGKQPDDEVKTKISNSLKGIKRSEDTVSKMKLSAYNRTYVEKTCPYCKKKGTHNMNRYHFGNCKKNKNV